MSDDPAPYADTLTLLACQISIPAMTAIAERNAHLTACVAKVDACLKASTRRVDLVVMPELSSLDYARDTFENLAELAEPLDGPSFQAWRRLAQDHEVHVVYGFARAAQDGPRICSAVVGPQGQLVGYYDKLHLAQYGASMEKDYFTRGEHLLVFTLKGFRIAPIICYDIRFPDLSRVLVVDHEVDLLLHCGAYYRDESFHTWHAFATTRALENQVHLLSLNRAGQSYGNSVFCLPWHDETCRPEVFEGREEDFRLITLDQRTQAKVRERYTFLKDRIRYDALFNYSDKSGKT
ncbi:MAG: carbon-nitrogen hydrolase family protein [Pseudomonadota bacterium]